MASQEVYYVPDGSKWPIVGTFHYLHLFRGAMMFNNAILEAIYFNCWPSLSNLYVCMVGFRCYQRKFSWKV